MITIEPQQPADQHVIVPGSKSYTHRMLIAAALAQGVSQIANALDSEDTTLTRRALSQMGAGIEVVAGKVVVTGTAGRLAATDQVIDLRNSGTSMRLLTAVAALGQGLYRLTGTQRMQQRPLQPLLNALNQIGVSAAAVNRDGCPPVEIKGGGIDAKPVDIDCSTSSQFLSGLLLIAPYTTSGLEITVSRGPVSKPYIDLTLAVMQAFGVTTDRAGYQRFSVPGQQVYRAGNYRVEPDCSQAGYFWAAAAVTGAAIKVLHIHRRSVQGDIRFVDVLEAMGCRVFEADDGISVQGGELSAIEVDMGDMPDLVPTLAVVAAFAKGTTLIRNVAHLKVKESDRLSAVITELHKMGVVVHSTGNDLQITGGNPRGAVIDTYDDHRMAMSFAVAGLRVPGVKIRNESCVQKSFPNFWEVFLGLRAKG